MVIGGGFLDIPYPLYQDIDASDVPRNRKRVFESGKV